MNPDNMVCLWCNDHVNRIIHTWEKPQDKQIECAEEISKRRGKKGKERKNWQNNNTIWQGKRRFI